MFWFGVCNQSVSPQCVVRPWLGFAFLKTKSEIVGSVRLTVLYVTIPFGNCFVFTNTSVNVISCSYAPKSLNYVD